MYQLNYHHLYYFKVIATEGSISKAAEKLRLGQPALSMQLKQFEDHLGTKLFERKGRSLVLTEMGRMALGYAEQIYRLGDELMDSIHDRAVPSRVKVQIGFLDGVSKIWSQRLVELALKWGDCHVSVFEGHGPELIEQMVDHKLDLVVTNYAPTIVKDNQLQAKKIKSDPLVIVGSSRFVNLARQFPFSLQGQPFVVPTLQNRLRSDLEHFFEQHNVKPQVVAEVQDSELCLRLGLSGVGLVVGAKSSFDQELEKKRLVFVGEIPRGTEDLYLIAAPRKLQNPVVKYLMTHF